jgi:DNA-binding transcriptional MerR regulator
MRVGKEEEAAVETLMPIGVFARASRLSIRVLRNYDRLGLLSPARVDPDTGYRSYAVGQFARAELIRTLRDLDVPLAEIAAIVAADATGDRDSIRTAIERHRARVLDRSARLAHIAERLDAMLADAAPAPVYERHRDVQPTARVLIRTRVDDLAAVIGPAYADLFTALAAQQVAAAGPAGARYFGDDPDDDLDVELFIPVDRPVRAHGRVAPGELPAALLAATVHTGGYDSVCVAYHSLGRWIAEHGRELAGPAEERYLVPPGPGSAPADLCTELAWPIRVAQT